MGWLEWLDKEWKVLVRAPRTFIVLSAISFLAGVTVASWYFSGQLSDRDARISLRDDELAAKGREVERLRVAAGLDKASESALIALTNKELKAKAAITVWRLRDFEASVNRRREPIAKLRNEGKITPKEAADRLIMILKEASAEFQRDLRADAANLDTELRRRLGPEAVAGIVGVPPSFFSASDGTAIGVDTVATSVNLPFSAAMAGVLANGIDQMAKLLPSDNAN
jgi:hypothetical protein